MTRTELAESLIGRVERMRAERPRDPRPGALRTARAAVMGGAAVGVTVALALSPEDRAKRARRRLIDWARDTLDDVRAEPAPPFDGSPLRDLSMMEPIEVPREPKPTVRVPTPEEVRS